MRERSVFDKMQLYIYLYVRSSTASTILLSALLCLMPLLYNIIPMEKHGLCAIKMLKLFDVRYFSACTMWHDMDIKSRVCIINYRCGFYRQ